MNPIAVNVWILLQFLAYVMRRAGTFTLEEKVRMIECISRIASNPDQSLSEEVYVVRTVGR
jgi:hypothetical protein